MKIQKPMKKAPLICVALVIFSGLAAGGLALIAKLKRIPIL